MKRFRFVQQGGIAACAAAGLVAMVAMLYGTAGADIYNSDGALGPLTLTGTHSVAIDTDAMTMTDTTGAPVLIATGVDDGGVTVFKFSDVNVGSGVTIEAKGGPTVMRA